MRRIKEKNRKLTWQRRLKILVGSCDEEEIVTLLDLEEREEIREEVLITMEGGDDHGRRV